MLLPDASQRSQKSEVRGRRADDSWFKVLNIEPQNKKPQNDEVITSIFEIPCSIFCGSKREQHKKTGPNWTRLKFSENRSRLDLCSFCSSDASYSSLKGGFSLGEIYPLLPFFQALLGPFLSGSRPL